MFEYDARLLTALEAPSPQTIAEVITLLETIDGICAEGDGLKWFNGLYLGITRAVAGGTYSDPAWLLALDVHFAGFYFRALAGWLAGQPISECWRVLFERRNDTRLARFQFALAGVNAHINHDLCAAIVETCKATGTVPHHGGVHYRDYTALNVILDQHIDDAKRTLMVRLLGDELPPVSHLEDILAAVGLLGAREKAWVNAEILWRLPVLDGGYLASIDGLTAVIGRALLVAAP